MRLARPRRQSRSESSLGAGIAQRGWMNRTHHCLYHGSCLLNRVAAPWMKRSSMLLLGPQPGAARGNPLTL
jgi:hypothetical protein